MDYRLRDSILPLRDSYNIIEKIFARRGIEPVDIDHYLNTTDNDIVPAEQIANIDEGINMLFNHIKAQDEILFIVDCDVDGYTSSAILINYLNRLFPGYAQNYISYRVHSGKQHGLRDQMDYIKEHKEFKLIVLPDSSSNDYDQHRQLKVSGVDVLIIDHHEAEYVSKNACVINNQLCDYPTKSLSGAGMVYKFCKRIDERLELDFADHFLDLAATGMVGDMMSLLDYETKHLITKGLASIENPCISKLRWQQDFSIRKYGVCPFSFSFYIVPLINATIRSGSFEEKSLLFEAMLDFKAYEQIPSTKRGCKGQTEPIVDQACRNCSNLKRKQDNETDELIPMIEKIIADKGLENNKVIAVQLLPAQIGNRNLTGLVANKLTAKYKKPVLILTKTERGWEGSGRAFEFVDFMNFKDFCEGSGLTFTAQGHQAAFGFGITDQNFDLFIDYANEKLADINFTRSEEVDFIWLANDISYSDVVAISKLPYVWGQNLKQPYVAIEHCAITQSNIAKLGRSTMKISLPNGIEMIKFWTSDEELEALTPTNSMGAVFINVIGECSMNSFSNTPQILIKNYEIVGVEEYYF